MIYLWIGFKDGFLHEREFAVAGKQIMKPYTHTLSQNIKRLTRYRLTFAHVV